MGVQLSVRTVFSHTLLKKIISAADSRVGGGDGSLFLGWSPACWLDEAVRDKLRLNPVPSGALAWKTRHISPKFSTRSNSRMKICHTRFI